MLHDYVRSAGIAGHITEELLNRFETTSRRADPDDMKVAAFQTSFFDAWWIASFRTVFGSGGWNVFAHRSLQCVELLLCESNRARYEREVVRRSSSSCSISFVF